MHDRARANAVMTVNVAAKTNLIVAVITVIPEMMRRNVSLSTSLTELLARVQMKSFQWILMGLGVELGMLVQTRYNDEWQWEG
jgi:predicted Kef-type K+ transport protein